MREPEIFQLSVAAAFEGLTSKEQLYAHHTARAAWHGARIILRQVSPEATDIFDFIMALHHSCDGQWEHLARRAQVDMTEVEKFLDYAAVFLSPILEITLALEIRSSTLMSHLMTWRSWRTVILLQLNYL